MAIAVFNSAIFKARYPEFALVSDALLAVLFGEAGLYLSNTDTSPVRDITLRTTLLNQLTAHIASIGGVLNADGQPNPVGRTSSATEGGVSASFEYSAPLPGSGPWFNQSAYGAAFWQATTNLRGFRYIPSRDVFRIPA